MGKVTIIAEIGINHNGDFEVAKRMVDVAKKSGADIAKFQTGKLDAVVSKYADMAEYQKNNIGKTMSQKEMLRGIHFSFDGYAKLADYCSKKGIQFLSTPFDIYSVHFLDGIQNLWKVPSGEITNYPYLVEIGKTQKKVILSTGMCTLDEIRSAIDVLRENGTPEIVLLHCTTDYPTPFEDVNLNAMLTLKNEFGLEVGYSDHTRGIEVSIAAVAMGATVIEKHFTLDRNMPGPDHKASIEPDELNRLVASIRNVEIALGSFEKQPSNAEVKNKDIARKSIIAARNISKGEVLTEANLTTKRPGNGISPMRWNEIIGSTAVRDFEEDELIEI